MKKGGEKTPGKKNYERSELPVPLKGGEGGDTGGHGRHAVAGRQSSHRIAAPKPLLQRADGQNGPWHHDP